MVWVPIELPAAWVPPAATVTAPTVPVPPRVPPASTSTAPVDRAVHAQRPPLTVVQRQCRRVLCSGEASQVPVPVLATEPEPVMALASVARGTDWSNVSDPVDGDVAGQSRGRVGEA